MEREWAGESREVRQQLTDWLHEHGGWDNVLRPRAMSFNCFMVSAVCADGGDSEACKRYENRRSQHMGLAVLHQSHSVVKATSEWAPTVAQACSFDPLRITEEGLSELGGVSRAVGWLEPFFGQRCPDPEVANVWRVFNTSGTIQHGWWRRVVSVPAGLFQVKGSLCDFSLAGAIHRGFHASHYSCAVAMLLDRTLPLGWEDQAASSTQWDEFVTPAQHHAQLSGASRSCTAAQSSASVPPHPTGLPTEYQLLSSRQPSRPLQEVQAIFRHCTGQACPPPPTRSPLQAQSAACSVPTQSKCPFRQAVETFVSTCRNFCFDLSKRLFTSNRPLFQSRLTLPRMRVLQIQPTRASLRVFSALA